MIHNVPNSSPWVKHQSPRVDGEQSRWGWWRRPAASRLCLCVFSPSVKALKKLSSTCCPDCFSHRFTTVCTCLRRSRWDSTPTWVQHNLSTAPGSELMGFRNVVRLRVRTRWSCSASCTNLLVVNFPAALHVCSHSLWFPLSVTVLL